MKEGEGGSASCARLATEFTAPVKLCWASKTWFKPTYLQLGRGRRPGGAHGIGAMHCGRRCGGLLPAMFGYVATGRSANQSMSRLDEVECPAGWVKKRRDEEPGLTKEVSDGRGWAAIQEVCEGGRRLYGSPDSGWEGKKTSSRACNGRRFLRRRHRLGWGVGTITRCLQLLCGVQGVFARCGASARRCAPCAGHRGTGHWSDTRDTS